MPLMRPQSIPAFLLIRTAFQLLWQQKDDALRLGFVPVLLCFGGFLYGQQDLQALIDAMNAYAMQSSPNITSPLDFLPDGAMGGVLVMVAIQLLAYCLVAVNWLRFVLLGPMAAVGLGLNIGRPHAAYLIACVSLMAVAFIVLAVATMPASLLPGFLGQVASVAVCIIVAALSARFVPFVVALAIGQTMSLQQAWATSRGNGISLVVALVLAYVPFMIFVMLISTILGVTGFAVVAPIATLFISAVIQIAACICQAGVLATAYRHMVGIKV